MTHDAYHVVRRAQEAPARDPGTDRPPAPDAIATPDAADADLLCEALDRAPCAVVDAIAAYFTERGRITPEHRERLRLALRFVEARVPAMPERCDRCRQFERVYCVGCLGHADGCRCDPVNPRAPIHRPGCEHALAHGRRDLQLVESVPEHLDARGFRVGPWTRGLRP